MDEETFRRIRGQIGAYSLHAQYDSKAITANARAAFLSKFEKQVDPEGKLPDEERIRRAAMARSAHFRKLALRSAKARAARARVRRRTDMDGDSDGHSDN